MCWVAVITMVTIIPTLFTVQQQMKEASRTDLYVTLVPDNPQQVSLTLGSVYVFAHLQAYTDVHTYMCA